MSNTNSFYNFAKACLRPPGEGVYTVSNARDRKMKLHNILYKDSKDVQESWLKSLQSNLKNGFNKVATLGICSDTGGGIQRGANWGPLFLREAMLSTTTASNLDLGDVFVVPQLLHDKYLNQDFLNHVKNALYQDPKSPYPVSPLSIAEETVSKFYAEYPNAKIFGIGGDHSVSYPLVKAWAQAKSRAGKKIGLIHFDAHTDLMIERLGIDLCFGTWVPHILPFFNDPSNVYQIGIRSSGQERSHWENTFGVHQVWTKEIQEKGIKVCLENFDQYLKDKKFDEVYISFDIDALDAGYAPATGTPEFGGMAPHEAKMFIDVVGKHCKVTGADMVEIAPFVQIHDNPQGQWSTLQCAALLSQAMIELMERN